MSRHAVLVTGGRDYADIDAVDAVVNELPPETLIVNGGADGADSLVNEAAIKYGYPCATLPFYHWHGRAGGHIRNGDMVEIVRALRDAGWLVKVVAFPGGRGTANCVQQARAAGLPIQHVE